MSDPHEGFHLSEPLSDDDIQRIYDDDVLDQSFYGDTYTASLEIFVSEAADQMARHIVDTFAPTRVLDVGCGLGQLVHALRLLGVDARGCDYSDTFVTHAPPEIRPYLEQRDIAALSEYGDDEFDLVLCMEVLEHLPVPGVRRAVGELQRISSGPVVVTVPSFGPNWPGRYGLAASNESWFADGRSGRRFSQIVLDPAGKPHHGHLTLATYAWWTDLFASHGLVRNRDIENSWLEHPDRPLWHHRWNVYVLHRADGAAFRPGDHCVAHIAHGWYGVEQWPGDLTVRWTARVGVLHLVAPCDEPVLHLHLSAGPDLRMYPVPLVVSVRPISGDATRTQRLRIEPGGWVDLRLDQTNLRAGDIAEITLESPRPFRPADLPGSPPDDRELGVAVRLVALEIPDGGHVDGSLDLDRLLDVRAH